MIRHLRPPGLLIWLLICSVPAAFAESAEPPASPESPSEVAPLERIVVLLDDAEKTIHGRTLSDAEDDGLLFESTDGRLYNVDPTELKSRTALDRPFRPLSHDEMGRLLQAEIGHPSEVVVTRHYVICSRTGKAYARWCGALFERLYAGFHNYWKQRGLTLHEPEFPLPAIILADEKQFAEFAARDAGPEFAAVKGYYWTASNRMALYDLTGAAGADQSPGDISRKLAAAPFNIATVVHEATHQIAFNSGMHRRYADNPLWLTEGMAMYFETPDLTSNVGWKSIGTVSDLRLSRFKEILARGRGGDSLATLVRSDERFADPEQMLDAYAEAWALSYYLIRTRKEDYCRYLQTIAVKPRLFWDAPETRLAEFRVHFGEDLQSLDAEFLRYVRRLRK